MSYVPYRTLSLTKSLLTASKRIAILFAAVVFAIFFLCTWQLTVAASPALILANDDEITTTEEVAVAIDILANDAPVADLDLTSFQILLSPSYGTYSVQTDNGLTIIYQPHPNFGGEDLFEYQICDSNGSSCGQAIVNIYIASVNDEIIAVDDSVTALTGTSLEIDTLRNDIDYDLDMDLATLTVMDSARRGTVEVVDGHFRYFTDEPGGVDQFSYQICDNPMASEGRNSTSKTLTETVSCSVAKVDITIGEIKSVREELIANRLLNMAPGGVSRNSPPSIRLVADPTNGAAVIEQDGTVSYQPAAGFSGTDEFMMELCREPAECEVIRYSITVGFIRVHLPLLSL